jgi:hypothetical protein
MPAVWPRYEVSVPQPNNLATDLNDKHTITVTTLGLIVAGAVAVLLLVLAL